MIEELLEPSLLGIVRAVIDGSNGVIVDRIELLIGVDEVLGHFLGEGVVAVEIVNGSSNVLPDLGPGVLPLDLVHWSSVRIGEGGRLEEGCLRGSCC